MQTLTANNIPFGEIVDARLKDLNWTKSDLARRLDVTPSRIRVLLQQPSMTEDSLKKLCFVLGLAIDIRETSRPTPPVHQRAQGRMTIGDEQ
jgi:plasmid maintenance system antidote protein VapI